MKKIFISTLFLLSFSFSCFALEEYFGARVTPVPPFLIVNADFSEPSGNRALDAEESGSINLTIKNTGQGDAYDVVLRISTDKTLRGLNFDETIKLGTIPSNSTFNKEIRITTTEYLPKDKVTFYIKTFELNGFNPKTVGVAFETRQFLEPELKVVDFKVIDANKNGKIEPIEQVEIKARIQNVGQGPAQDVKAEVVLGENVFIGGSLESEYKLGNLNPGKFKDVSFIVYGNSLIPDKGVLPVSLKITESRGRFDTRENIRLVMSNPDNIGTVKVVDAEEDKYEKVKIATGLTSEIERNIPEGLKRAGDYDIAVVIGNSDYKYIPPVDFAKNDAMAVKNYLMKTFGYREGNIIYVEDATLSKFNEIFGNSSGSNSKLKNYVKPNVSNVFIYYVGHGAPDLDTTDAYFVPVDADPNYISSGGYKLQVFYDNIKKIKAKNMTVILDACFSGDSAKGMLFKNVSPGALKVKEEYQKPENATLFASSSFRQVSTWYPEKEHSTFTYWFLLGLQGKADGNDDKKITVGEMANYLKENVSYTARRMHGVSQDPQVDGNPAAVLVVLK